MKYPNAYAGIKKIFAAEIIQIIAVIAMIIGFVFAIGGMAAAVVPEADTDAAFISAGSGFLFILAAFVLLIIGFIFNLVGLARAKKDEHNFGTAFWLVIISLACSIISVFIQTMNPWLYGWLDFVSSIFRISSIEVTIIGILNLAVALRNDSVAKFAGVIRIFITILWIVVIVMRVWRNNIALNPVLANTISTVYLVLELLVFILFIILLTKAKKMLEAN